MSEPLYFTILQPLCTCESPSMGETECVVTRHGAVYVAPALSMEEWDQLDEYLGERESKFSAPLILDGHDDFYLLDALRESIPDKASFWETASSVGESTRLRAEGLMS